MLENASGFTLRSYFFGTDSFTGKAGKNLWSPQEVPRKSPGSPVSAVTQLLVRNVMFLLTLSGRAVTANLENPESQHRMHVIWGKSGFPHMDVVTRWRILHIITTSVPIWILVFLNSATQTLVSVNSLTDIDAHERQLFHDLHCSLVTSLICVLYKCLIARKIVELFNFNHGKRPFYAACSLSELRRRSVLCLWIASFGKGFLIFYPKNDDHDVRRGNTMQILAWWRCQKASRLDIDLLYPAMHSWQSKLPTMEVHLFFAAAFFHLTNHS